MTKMGRIACDTCLLWYHGVCMGVNVKKYQGSKTWTCNKCGLDSTVSEIGPYYGYKRNYPTKKWGDKSIFERQVGFIFHVGQESRMVRYFKMFLDSGIYFHVSFRLVSLNATILREREANSGKVEKLRYATSSFKLI